MANSNVILQWNCRGLKDKRHEIDMLIACYSPAVICLQETILSSEIEKKSNEKKPLPNSVKSKNYTPYFKCIDT